MEEMQLDEKELQKKLKKEDKAREKAAKKKKAEEKAKKFQAQPSDGSKKEKKVKKRGTEDENPEDFIDPLTPDGEKKQLSSHMAKQYNPTVVEKSWYAWWEKSKFFVADENSFKPPFVIVLPPPNVTGALHIGHALTAAIQVITWLFSNHCISASPCHIWQSYFYAPQFPQNYPSTRVISQLCSSEQMYNIPYSLLSALFSVNLMS